MANYEKNNIKELVLSTVDIVELIESYNITVEKKGNEYVALCPFHNDSHPSLKINQTLNRYACFACPGDSKGNVIDFVMQIEKIPFKEALYKLAEKYLGIKEFSYKSEKEKKLEVLYEINKKTQDYYYFNLIKTEEGTNALKYLEDRFVDIDSIKKFKIGLSPANKGQTSKMLIEQGYKQYNLEQLNLIHKTKNNNQLTDMFNDRIMFPITDDQGRVVAFSGRKYNTNDDSPKYINSAVSEIFEKNKILYNLHNAKQSIKEKQNVYICEGFMDVIRVDSTGINNVIAIMGTKLTENHIQSLLKLTNKITFLLDGDNAGINSTYELIKNIDKMNNYNSLLIDVVVIPDKLDPDEYILENGYDKFINFISTNILDKYEFLYYYELKKINRNNSNEKEIFKNLIFEMLRRHNSSVTSDKLLRKLEKDLKIDYAFLINEFFGQVNINENELNKNKNNINKEFNNNKENDYYNNLIDYPRNHNNSGIKDTNNNFNQVKNSKISNNNSVVSKANKLKLKEIAAEKQILVQMLHDRDFTINYKYSNNNTIINEIVFSIRAKIENHFTKYKTLDIDEFTNNLTEAEQNELKIILKEFPHSTDQEYIEDCIKIIILSPYYTRLNDLYESLRKNDDEHYVVKQDLLKKISEVQCDIQRIERRQT